MSRRIPQYDTNRRRSERLERAMTAYICDACRKASKEKQTHHGQMHAPGICDCPCRGPVR